MSVSVRPTRTSPNSALVIFQFSLSEKGPRIPILYTDLGVTLFTFDDLAQMVRDTMKMWREVCEATQLTFLKILRSEGRYPWLP
jgi:hypothetical protein